MSSFKFTTFIFLSQRRDYVIFRQAGMKLLDLLSLTLKYSKKKDNAKELGVGRRQFHAGINEFILFISYNITLS